MNERQARIALNMIPGVGPLSFFTLIEHLGSALQVLTSSEERLCAVPGIGPKLAQSIRSFPAEASLEREEKQARSLGIRTLIDQDPDYPRNLSQIPSKPPVLYLKGELKEADGDAIAIVGSRRATGYGKGIAGELAFDLASCGLTVVSGMAMGIDTAVHLGALKAGGKTIAVWGSGLDCLYPPQNREIAERIPQSGALLSEFPLGTSPLPGNFPRRNRIISGISLGVVVVEAGERSGALITAHFAADQGREVFAIPGSIYLKGSKGCHRLIKMGAKLVEGTADILEELRLQHPLPGIVPSRAREGNETTLERGEALLYQLLSDRPLHIDDLIVNSGLPAHQVASLLMNLEIKGFCRQERGKLFLRAV